MMTTWESWRGQWNSSNVPNIDELHSTLTEAYQLWKDDTGPLVPTRITFYDGDEQWSLQEGETQHKLENRIDKKRRELWQTLIAISRTYVFHYIFPPYKDKADDDFSFYDAVIDTGKALNISHPRWPKANTFDVLFYEVTGHDPLNKWCRSYDQTDADYDETIMHSLMYALVFETLAEEMRNYAHLSPTN
jgi:hypothetical protein